MQRRDFDIDHIDPRWEEGRNYQLVCGLDCQANLREEDRSVNAAKANRFLPWRWSRDEIGVVPEEPGDLAQFLVNGEWVLMEFLSEEWFKASVGTCSRSYRDVNVEAMQKGLKEWKDSHKKEAEDQLRDCQDRYREYTKDNPGHFGQMWEGSKRWREENPERAKENIQKAISVRSMCTVTGKISRPGPLTQWQRKRGIDPSNRIRIE